MCNDFTSLHHNTCHVNNPAIVLTICLVRADLEARAGIKISPETSMLVQQANALREAKGEKKERLQCSGGPVSLERQKVGDCNVARSRGTPAVDV